MIKLRRASWETVQRISVALGVESSPFHVFGYNLINNHTLRLLDKLADK